MKETNLLITVQVTSYKDHRPTRTCTHNLKIYSTLMLNIVSGESGKSTARRRYLLKPKLISKLKETSITKKRRSWLACILANYANFLIRFNVTREGVWAAKNLIINRSNVSVRWANHRTFIRFRTALKLMKTILNLKRCKNFWASHSKWSQALNKLVKRIKNQSSSMKDSCIINSSRGQPKKVWAFKKLSKWLGHKNRQKRPRTELKIIGYSKMSGLCEKTETLLI